MYRNQITFHFRSLLPAAAMCVLEQHAQDGHALHKGWQEKRIREAVGYSRHSSSYRDTRQAVPGQGLDQPHRGGGVQTGGAC